MEAIASPAVLGESPLCRPGELVFVDMLAGVLRRIALETLAESTAHVVADGIPYAGAVVAAADGSLAVITIDGVVHLDRKSGPVRVATIVDGAERRLNDAAVDPLGRLWVGSVALDGRPGTGAMHLWSPAAGAKTVHEGMSLPNGIGWSPDGGTAYVIDSGTRELLAATVDTVGGAVGPFRRRHLFSGPGEPDGLAVASDGTIWVAIWDGARIDRLSPDGDLLGSLEVPVSRPTALAFGDGELFVTTARHGLAPEALDAEPLAGRVLRLPVMATGLDPRELITA